LGIGDCPQVEDIVQALKCGELTAPCTSGNNNAIGGNGPAVLQFDSPAFGIQTECSDAQDPLGVEPVVVSFKKKVLSGNGAEEEVL
jgi:hypothetical protein